MPKVDYKRSCEHLEKENKFLRGQLEPKDTTAQPPRVAMLNRAAQLTGVARQRVYGDAVANMTHFADMLTAYFNEAIHEDVAKGGFEFSHEDAAMIMVLAKISRISVGKWHEDNFVDGAAYLAIAGECKYEDYEKCSAQASEGLSQNFLKKDLSR